MTEIKLNRRTLEEQKAYMEGYIAAMSNIFERIEEIMKREKNMTASLIEMLKEQNESENLS